MSEPIIQSSAPAGPATPPPPAGDTVRASPPAPWESADLIAAAGWAILALGAWHAGRYLSDIWTNVGDFNHCFLLPPLAAYFAWETSDAFRAAPRRPTAWGAVLIAGGAAGYLGVMWLAHYTGPRPVPAYLLGASLITAAVGLMLVQHGPARLRVWAFPFVLLMLALPVPDALRLPLQHKLKMIATDLSASVLKVFIPELTREGTILRLPSGDLGVADACSGIRSLIALSTFAFLLTYLKECRIIFGAAMLAASVPIAVVVNLVRIVATGLIQQNFGRQYTQDLPGEIPWHTILGMAVFVLGIALMLWVGSLVPSVEEELAARRKAADDAAGGSGDADDKTDPTSESAPVAATPAAAPTPDGAGVVRLTATSWPASTVLTGAVTAVLAVAAAVGWWAAGQAPPPILKVGLDKLPHMLDGWVAEDLDGSDFRRGEPPLRKLLSSALGSPSALDQRMREMLRAAAAEESLGHIHEQLNYNEIIHRVYRGSLGRTIQVWVMFYASDRSTSGGPHSPDVCMPMQGHTMDLQGVTSVPTPSRGGAMPVQLRIYRKGADANCLLYWYQHGSAVNFKTGWNDAEHGYLQTVRGILGGTLPAPRTHAQLFVMVTSTDLSGDARSRLVLRKFAGRVVEEVYKICPWAVPPPEASVPFEPTDPGESLPVPGRAAVDGPADDDALRTASASAAAAGRSGVAAGGAP